MHLPFRIRIEHVSHAVFGAAKQCGTSKIRSGTRRSDKDNSPMTSAHHHLFRCLGLRGFLLVCRSTLALLDDTSFPVVLGARARSQLFVRLHHRRQLVVLGCVCHQILRECKGDPCRLTSGGPR